MASHTLKSRDALTQCPCFSLHKRCNPITCNKAPSREKLAQESSQTGSIPPRWAVGCTLSALRRSALQGCFTCGIYYAGLSIPGYFAYRGNEDHIQVKIKNNGADVYAYNTANDYVYGELEFFTIKESNFRSSCQLFSVPKIYSSTSSEDSFQDITRWMKQCRTHPGCQSGNFSMLPTRVLDVGSSDESNPIPYLLEPGDFKGDYVTLSHCWGDAHIATTTKESLPRRKEGIEVSLLPKTFVDAILITRKLKFRYLWIDSLCIIQDDEADWQRESKKMAKIHENSVLTISASEAPHGEYGCFGQTSNLLGLSSWAITVIQDLELDLGDSESELGVLGFHVDKAPMKDKNQFRTREYYGSNETRASDRVGGSIVAIYNQTQDSHISLRVLPDNVGQAGNTASPLSTKLNSSSGIFVRKPLRHHEFFTQAVTAGGLPLFQRGWAFQERFLSFRVLHYTYQELVWECNTTSKCQCGRILSQMDVFRPGVTVNQVGRAPKPTFAYSSLRKLASDDLIDQWQTIVFQYSNRGLSYDADRLPALSGLAKRFQTYNIGVYAAGLWEKHLHTQILWRSSAHGKLRTRSSKYIAPTWSWASLSGGVYFLGAQAHRPGNNILRCTKIVGSILEVHCTPGGLDALGSVVDGYLRVRGQIVQATLTTAVNPRRQHELSEGPETSERSPPYLFEIVNDKDGSSCRFVPDSLSDIDVLTPRQSIFCLLWSLSPKQEPRKQESQPLDNIEIFSTMLILRSSQRQPRNYERIGLIPVYEDESKRGGHKPKDRSPAINVSEWFYGQKSVDITIV